MNNAFEQKKKKSTPKISKGITVTKPFNIVIYYNVGVTHRVRNNWRSDSLNVNIQKKSHFFNRPETKFNWHFRETCSQVVSCLVLSK